MLLWLKRIHAHTPEDSRSGDININRIALKSNFGAFVIYYSTPNQYWFWIYCGNFVFRNAFSLFCLLFSQTESWLWPRVKTTDGDRKTIHFNIDKILFNWCAHVSTFFISLIESIQFEWTVAGYGGFHARFRCSICEIIKMIWWFSHRNQCAISIFTFFRSFSVRSLNEVNRLSNKIIWRRN